MRTPSSADDRVVRRSHPAKAAKSTARSHGHHGFSRPMSIERLEARLPLSSTPVAGPIPSATPAQTVSGNPAFQSIAGGDETNQSLAQTSFIAGGPAAGIGPAGAGGSAGIGGGIVETGFTGTEFSPFNLEAGSFGGVHMGVIGEGPESTGNPSNDTRGAGPGAFSNPAGSQMEWPGFNRYAVAETANFGFGSRFGPDTGYPAPLPDDALLPRLFPRMTSPLRPALGDQRAPEANEQSFAVVGVSRIEETAIGQAADASEASRQEMPAVETLPQRASNDASPADSFLAVGERLLSEPESARPTQIRPIDQLADATPQSAAPADRAERADRVMAGLIRQTSEEPEPEVVEAGTSAEASLMSAALVTVVFDGSRVRDNFWRTATEPKPQGKRLSR